MKIGIIGAGQIGSTLVRGLRALGHEVYVANSRGPESLAQLAADTGAHAVQARQAARAGDVVVVTIPQAHVAQLRADLFEGVSPEVAVVDTGNYYPRQRDGRIEPIESGMLESRWVEQQLQRPVVKAFNNIYAHSLATLGKPAGSAGRVALPICGDRDADKLLVGELIDALGFDVIDVGPLEESWRQQPGTPVYCKDYDAVGVRRALAEASRERTEEWRGTAQSPGSFEQPR